MTSDNSAFAMTAHHNNNNPIIMPLLANKKNFHP
jgi:hypothetical protein